MDKNYREFLERQLKEAQQEFEAVKASAITDLQGMQPYYAQDWGGAAYFTKIDKVTAAGTKVQQWAQALKAYDYYTKQEENK